MEEVLQESFRSGNLDPLVDSHLAEVRLLAAATQPRTQSESRRSKVNREGAKDLLRGRSSQQVAQILQAESFPSASPAWRSPPACVVSKQSLWLYLAISDFPSPSGRVSAGGCITRIGIPSAVGINIERSPPASPVATASGLVPGESSGGALADNGDYWGVEISTRSLPFRCSFRMTTYRRHPFSSGHFSRSERGADDGGAN